MERMHFMVVFILSSLSLSLFCPVQACVGSRHSGWSRGTWPWGLEPRLCWSVKCRGPRGPCSGWRMACFWGHTGLCPATHATPWLVMRTEVRSRDRWKQVTVVIEHMQGAWFLFETQVSLRTYRTHTEFFIPQCCWFLDSDWTETCMLDAPHEFRKTSNI